MFKKTVNEHNINMSFYDLIGQNYAQLTVASSAIFESNQACMLCDTSNISIIVGLLKRIT